MNWFIRGMPAPAEAWVNHCFLSQGPFAKSVSNPRHMKLVAEGLLLGVAENHRLRGIGRNMLCECFTSGSRFLSKVLEFSLPDVQHIPWPGRSLRIHSVPSPKASQIESDLRDGQGVIPERVEAAKEQVNQDNQVTNSQWMWSAFVVAAKEQVAKGIELPPQSANFDSPHWLWAPQRLFNVSQPKSKTQSSWHIDVHDVQHTKHA